MNKFAAVFLILFFIMLIGVGALALNEEVLSSDDANQLCPIPKIPENPTCPTSQEMDLVKESNDCYIFKCVKSTSRNQ